MAWRITGTYWSPCSCNVGCPCLFGEMEADKGWCSGSLAFEIRSGNVNGTDVGGAKLVLVGDWPSGFLGGNGTGRIYFDSAVSQQQRSLLEPIFKGQRGGVLEPVGALMSTFLPSKEAPMNIQKGPDGTRIKVGHFGEVVSTPLRGASGEVTRVLHAAAAFRDDIVLSKGTGTRWHDPDMRQWESAGHSEQADFDWTG